MGNSETARLESEVRAAMTNWLRAFNTKDRTGFLDLYDPQVVYANEHAPLRRGIDEVDAAFAGAFADAGARIDFREEALFVSSEMALITGTYHFSAVYDASVTSPGSSGRVALLYRLSADGRWLLSFDIDNSPPDAAGLR